MHKQTKRYNKVFGGKQLRDLLLSKKRLRLIEAHSGLAGLIAESISVEDGLSGSTIAFDGMWSSSLTDSLLRGKPDISAVDFSSRLITLQQIMEVTQKPILVDLDNGGSLDVFSYHLRAFETLGVPGVVIEDKVGNKRNSLLGKESGQMQDSIENFSKKIKVGKASQRTKDFMIFARIESLILEKGLTDAHIRGKAFLKAGADGVLIHSKSKSPGEILEFAQDYKSYSKGKPLIVVPSTYSETYESELWDAGANIIIYANQLLRAAHVAMIKCATSILINGRSADVEKEITSIENILKIIPINDYD